MIKDAPIGLAVTLLAGCCSSARPGGPGQIDRRTFVVERVVNGHTFQVRCGGKLATVRLWGVDAPPKTDTRGPAATGALAGLIIGKTVRLEFPGPHKCDRLGRWLCKAYLGATDVGEEMVLQGHAERR